MICYWCIIPDKSLGDIAQPVYSQGAWRPDGYWARQCIPAAHIVHNQSLILDSMHLHHMHVDHGITLRQHVYSIASIAAFHRLHPAFHPLHENDGTIMSPSLMDPDEVRLGTCWWICDNPNIQILRTMVTQRWCEWHVIEIWITPISVRLADLIKNIRKWSNDMTMTKPFLLYFMIVTGTVLKRFSTLPSGEVFEHQLCWTIVVTPSRNSCIFLCVVVIVKVIVVNDDSSFPEFQA